MSDERVIAIMYHYVRDRAGTAQSGIRGLDPDTLSRQLDRLCRQFEPITWPMLHAWHHDGAHLPQRCCLLTFDDGLADHADVVAPLLEARGLRGTFFVSGQTLETQRMDAAHQVHLLQTTVGDDVLAADVVEWLGRQHPELNRMEQEDSQAARRLYHYETPDRARLKYLLHHSLPIDVRNAMVDDLFSRHVGNAGEMARSWYLQPEQLVQLEEAGHTIGGHGYAHEPYLRLSAEDQQQDLARSAAALRTALGPGTRPFSYPYGSLDDSVAGRCAEAGFAQAFTTCPGWIQRDDDVFQLNRLDTIAVDAFLEKEHLCPSR